MRQAGALAPRDAPPYAALPTDARGNAATGDAEAAGRSEAATRSDAGRPSRILVVDDDAAVRRFVGDTLRSSGYDVAVAAGGRDALATVYGDSQAPALLLTDIEMPGMSGVELAARVRADRPAIRVVLMTGQAASAARARERAGLVEGVLLKPFGAAELLDAVVEALGGPHRRTLTVAGIQYHAKLYGVAAPRRAPGGRHRLDSIVMEPRDRLANLGLFGAAAVVWVLVGLVVTTRDPRIDSSAGFLGAGLVGLAIGLTTIPLFWLSVFARHRRIAYRGDWMRAIRRGAWVTVVVAVLVVLRLQNLFQPQIALFILAMVFVAEATLSVER